MNVLLTPRFSALMTAFPTALAVTVATASSEVTVSLATVAASWLSELQFALADSFRVELTAFLISAFTFMLSPRKRN
ncbi:hypothetical protein D3C81_2061600 [compost metagenome]